MMIEHTTEEFGTVAWAIDCSRKSLQSALILKDDREAACAYAKKCYKNHARGMYKHIMSKAKKAILVAEKEGLTIEKPYLIKDGSIWGLLDDKLSPYTKVILDQRS